jgi:hypothetical protein
MINYLNKPKNYDGGVIVWNVLWKATKNIVIVPIHRVPENFAVVNAFTTIGKMGNCLPAFSIRNMRKHMIDQ